MVCGGLRAREIWGSWLFQGDRTKNVETYIDDCDGVDCLRKNYKEHRPQVMVEGRMRKLLYFKYLFFNIILYLHIDPFIIKQILQQNTRLHIFIYTIV